MVAALHVEIAQLEASAAGHRADFEHERERADRLMAELLQATAEATAAREAAARLEGEVAVLRTRARTDSSIDTDAHAGWDISPRPWWKQTARLRVGNNLCLLIPPPGGAIVGQQ